MTKDSPSRAGDAAFERLAARSVAGPLGAPLLSGPDARRLLEQLASGALSSAAPEHELLPPPETAWSCALGALAPGEVPVEDLPQSFASALGPLLATRLLPQAAPQDVPLLLELLPSAPFGLARALVWVGRNFAAITESHGPARLDRGLVCLERRLDELPEGLDADLGRALGLPVVLGLLADLRVRCFEAGAPLRGESSAVQPLLLPLDALGLRSVLELFPAAPGSLSNPHMPLAPLALAGTASALMLLGSRAAAVRMAAMAVLVAPPGQTPAEASAVLRKLVGKRRTELPKPLIPAIYALGMRRT